MKFPSIIAAANLSLLGCVSLWAGDATTPVDYTQRDATFAPAGTITPEKKPLLRDSTLQDRRVEKTTIDKKPATVGDRRAAIDVQETRDKLVREKDSHRPEATEQTLSQFNHRESSIATATATTKPPTVSKYQDSLTAASASNMTRFPALDRATTAKINRFVFRKNAPDSPSLTGAALVTPAGGAAQILK